MLIHFSEQRLVSLGSSRSRNQNRVKPTRDLLETSVKHKEEGARGGRESIWIRFKSPTSENKKGKKGELGRKSLRVQHSSKGVWARLTH